MIEIKDRQTFGKVIAEALAKVDANKSLQTWEKVRWTNAIAKATVRIEEEGETMTWQPETDTLLIWTVKRSNQIYEANGVCQCEAFKNGQICWHRTAKQLIKRYYEALEVPALSKVTENSPVPANLSEFNSAPYLKYGSGKKVETFGSVRI